MFSVIDACILQGCKVFSCLWTERGYDLYMKSTLSRQNETSEDNLPPLDRFDFAGER